jgi:cyclase
MAKRPFERGGIFNGANPLVFERAKELRNAMTEAEIVLWNHLKSGIEGFKFRRQHPLGCYIVDFYCHQAKLVIEVDGSVHQLEEVKKRDEQKDKDLQNVGFTVIHFTNKEVMTSASDVLKKIQLMIKSCLNNNY